MDDLDDYFEYALDLPEAQRAQLMARLREEEPQLAERLQAALAAQVVNPDFACQTAARPAGSDQPDRVRHVTLLVGDVEKAARWYLEVFRCTLVRADRDRAVLAFAATEVHLARQELQPPSLTLLREDVAAMGPSMRRRDGVRGLHLVDPWGNAIEVVDGPPPGPSPGGSPGESPGGAKTAE